MKLHVLPGDAQVEEFRKTNIEGDVIVCRETLISGDVDADSLPEFWEQRAQFILSAFGEDEIEYHEKVADPLARLLDIPNGAEVNLWFEYELFCSVNMWFCLYLLSDSDADVYRVAPVLLEKENRWKGFGGMNSANLEKCFEARERLKKEDVAFGAELWNAYRRGDAPRLRELAKKSPDKFPYIEEVCEAAINKEDRPVEILREIRADGFETFPEIFPEFVKRAGEYGFGDVQVKYMLEKLI